jgi:Tol biopolymer transport system component
MNENVELIKKNGISKCSKKNIGYFTQFTSCEKIEVSCSKPDINHIISVIVDPKIISTRIVNTPKGISAEGQHLTGKKLCIEIQLNQKIMYVADSPNQSVHAVENTAYCSTYIIVPDCIDGSDPNNLLVSSLLRTEVYVEDISVQQLGKRKIDKKVYLLIQTEVAPTYKICCTEEHNCTRSNLFALYQDGTFKKQLTDFKDCKVFNPQWSPSGQSIAFLLKYKDYCSLCITSLKSSEAKHLTDPYTFPFISSYCWSVNNNTIYFASYIENKKEIFSINPFTLEWKQLTYGNSKCRSFKPKCSPDGTKIAFLKSIYDKVNLYTMNMNGLSTKQLTTEGYIKDFSWSHDCSSIVCITGNEGFPYTNKKHNPNQTLEDSLKEDGIFIVDTTSCDTNPILEPKNSLKIRKLEYSPNNNYISFVGKRFSCEDIYLYDLLKCKLINLTNHSSDIKIDDYTWKADSSSIYFSANDLVYINLYHVSLCDMVKTQVSNTTADGMQVSYRPRLV